MTWGGGFIAVLHTWSQTLSDHFHLHCLIPAGVLQAEGTWNPARSSFLFRTASVATAFRSRYLELLKEASQSDRLLFPDAVASLGAPGAFEELRETLQQKSWKVYVKRPFASPQRVLDYLGRYPHRVAIANHRIISIDGAQVSFRYQDRRDHHRTKLMSLEASEFLRQFLLHILPPRFMKIRHFGFLANRCKPPNLGCIRNQLRSPAVPAAGRVDWWISLSYFSVWRLQRIAGERISIAHEPSILL